MHCPQLFLRLYSDMYVKPPKGPFIKYDNIKEMVNVKFVNYFSGNWELIVYNASRISRFLWCPCILTKYSHKFAQQEDDTAEGWLKPITTPWGVYLRENISLYLWAWLKGVLYLFLIITPLHLSLSLTVHTHLL